MSWAHLLVSEVTVDDQLLSLISWVAETCILEATVVHDLAQLETCSQVLPFLPLVFLLNLGFIWTYSSKKFTDKDSTSSLLRARGTLR